MSFRHNSTSDSKGQNIQCSWYIYGALSRAYSIVRHEFFHDNVLLSPIKGDCAKVREWWEGVCEDLHLEARSFKAQNTRDRLKWCLKSTSRLFDEDCPRCDKGLSDAARAQWLLKATTEVRHEVRGSTEWSNDPIRALKAEVRALVGTRWAARRRKWAYIPDQQGCREVRSVVGGTLSADVDLFDGDHSLLRVGTAKSKGKIRVVTMQSAYVKQVLTPIHEALYDFIAIAPEEAAESWMPEGFDLWTEKRKLSFGRKRKWVVRGDVQRSDFRAIVNDRRPGENFISGDYEAATDNIYLEAVEAVVSVLCESKDLTDTERECLKESFTDLRVGGNNDPAYKWRTICRGSMMGNLMSFPILCLLNQATYQIARNWEGKNKSRWTREVRINGDDIMFCGSNDFFQKWKRVTSHYGFVVNTKKTGVSGRYLELNSRTFDGRTGRLVHKMVLSFCRRNNTPSDLLLSVLEGLGPCRKSTILYTLNRLMKNEISIRPILPHLIPTWLHRSLIKRRWYRTALSRGPVPINSVGVDRSCPVVVGPIPPPSWYRLIDDDTQKLQLDHIDSWRKVFLNIRNLGMAEKKIYKINKNGLFSKTFKRTIDRSQTKILETVSDHRWWFTIEKSTWGFLWPKLLLEEIEYDRDCWTTLVDYHDIHCRDEWLEDHPFLTTKAKLIRRKFSNPMKRIPPPALLLAGTIIGGCIMYPNGFI